MWQSHISDLKRFRSHPTSATTTSKTYYYSFPDDLAQRRQRNSQSPTSTMSNSSTSDASNNKTDAAPDNAGFLNNLTGMLKTPGVKNIEDRFTSAGGTANHTPGSASKLGSLDQTSNSGKDTGVGSAHFNDNIADQRSEPTVVGKAFNNMIYGQDKTK
ncbi:hypothetical protein PVAG01_05668 [Phlyctema vagabunda]|uniref:Uncharacterized protein n=1 Tax=Phlyctema vagabunda TaxID=108571 RepID=A0ABR4PLV6_9HELO